MGRHRKYATNAERQRAYRERNRRPADLCVPEHFDLPRETDGRPWTFRSFVWELVAQGVSVGFVATRLKVSRQVIRACLVLMPNALPQAASHSTEKSVTKTAWLPGFVAETWGEFPVDVNRRGRPRQWYDDKSRKRAWWMRKVAVQYKIAGFWADEAARIDQERPASALLRRPMLLVELDEPHEMREAA